MTNGTSSERVVRRGVGDCIRAAGGRVRVLGRALSRLVRTDTLDLESVGARLSGNAEASDGERMPGAAVCAQKRSAATLLGR
jgi:hypothetical protein